MATTPKNGSARSLERVRQHQTIIVEFSKLAAEATDLQRLLDLACQQAARATGVGHSKVMRYRSDKGDLLMVAGKGWKPGILGHARLGADMMSPAGRSYQTRDMVLIGDIRDDANYRMPGVLKEHGIVSLLNAPIALDGVVWGVLEVDSTTAEAFDDDDQQFLLAMAMILALAVRHRQAHSEGARRAEEMGRSLSQAETYMREQNHRVRNYFQMILSILASRSAQAAATQVRAEYQDVMERVTAIGMAHDLLTVQSGQSSVDAAVYIEALCLGLERSHGESLRLARDLDKLPLRADRAVPLGLVLNELLTNAIKYAVPHRADAIIEVGLSVDPDAAEATLRVRDNGPGMGEPRPGSLGLRLVRSLAAQISGRLHVDSSGAGTAVTLVFPLIE